MSIDDRSSAGTTYPPAPRTSVHAPGHPGGLVAAAEELIAGLVARPWGQVSRSVYETGRLVTFTPWLSGHDQRVSYLLATQRPDGTWGAPDDGYALVPTLSATEALLSTLTGPSGPKGSNGSGRQIRAIVLALRTLTARMCGTSAPRLDLPDLPAIELITPALIERINRSLEVLRDHPVPGLGDWAHLRLTPPAGMDGGKLQLVRSLLRSGAAVPQKLLHALEIAGEVAAGLPRLRPEPTGTIGASPAATAAWLGNRVPEDPSNPARWYLETVVSQHGGPVPVSIPLTVFERGWVLASLIRGGFPSAVPPQLVLSLTAPLGPAGTPAAAGLPADADTTAGALYALALLGAPHRPDPLYAYELDTHFCTWQGEDGSSITTNAHVLEAFGQYLTALRSGRHPGWSTAMGEGTAETERYAATAAKVARWLREQQTPDGGWTDRWHASPLYATACGAIALAKFGGEESAAAVRDARRWVLETQRPDGSWGRWEGTPEETSYAVQILLLTARPDEASLQAVMRGRPHLLRSLNDTDAPPEPALWHDKDLYRPAAIVRAAILTALYLIETATRVSPK